MRKKSATGQDSGFFPFGFSASSHRVLCVSQKRGCKTAAAVGKTTTHHNSCGGHQPVRGQLCRHRTPPHTLRLEGQSQSRSSGSLIGTRILVWERGIKTSFTVLTERSRMWDACLSEKCIWLQERGRQNWFSSKQPHRKIGTVAVLIGSTEVTNKPRATVCFPNTVWS